MDEELDNRLRYLRRTNCPSCGESMSLELFLGPNENGDLHVWHEGLCTHCLGSLVTSLPEVVLVMDETSAQIIAN